MAIEHRILEGGMGHSVSFGVEHDDGTTQELSVSVVEKGTHNFGTAKAAVRIKVVAGVLRANGTDKRFLVGDKMVFVEGELIVFVAETETALLVNYYA